MLSVIWKVIHLNKKWIGHVTKVFFNKIVFEVPHLENLRHNHRGDFYLGKGLNDYVSIYNSSNNCYVFQVTGLYEQEKPYSEIEESKFKETAFFEAVPVGEITKSGFEYGLSSFPMLNEDVYLTSIDDLKKIFNFNDIGMNMILGEMTSHRLSPTININQLLTAHMSILGNTGSGKSTTIRKILSELTHLKKKDINVNKMNFFIFDVHNEYRFIPDEYTNEVSINSISIPTETLSSEDWINLIQPSSAAQLPILMNGLRMASILNRESDHKSWIRAYCALELYNNQQTDAVTKRTKIIGLLEKIDNFDIDSILRTYSSQYGSISNGAETEFKSTIKRFIVESSGIKYEQCQQELISILSDEKIEIKNISDLWLGADLVILLEESKGNSQIRSYCSTLITRIENLMQTYSTSLFDSSSSKKATFENMMKFEKGFTVLDCSKIESNDLLFVSSFLLKLIFEKQKQERDELSGIESAFHLIFDEAHKYISIENDEDTLKSTKMFEKISKEGRKFGIFLILASQRPGELSKTVLSQCNNYILHRIRNNLDLEQMRKSIPFLNDMQLFRLSYLKTGTALMVGEAFSVPMELNIKGQEFGIHSQTVNLDEIWIEKS